jgi:hypothetical protein
MDEDLIIASLPTFITSEDIINLSLALNQFQAELVTVQRTIVNPFFKAKYADLATIMQESQPILTKHNLSISQFPDTISGQPALTTILMHVSGQFVRATIPLPISRVTVVTTVEPTQQKPNHKETTSSGYDPQEFGRALTYMRRYGYAAVLQIVIDEDDDGNKSSRQLHQEKMPEPPVELPSDPEMVEKIQTIWKESGGTDEQLDIWVRKNNNSIALGNLTRDRQEAMLKVLEAKKAERESKAKDDKNTVLELQGEKS